MMAQSDDGCSNHPKYINDRTFWFNLLVKWESFSSSDILMLKYMVCLDNDISHLVNIFVSKYFEIIMSGYKLAQHPI